MKNLAQVTLFIVIAIMVIGAIVGTFIFRNKIFSEQEYPSDILEVQIFVENCLRTTAKNSVVRIGERGGYFLIFNEPSIDRRIPYYLKGTQKTIPSKQEIELNLAGFVREELSFCILNFKEFEENFIIEHSLEKSETKIFEDSVIFTLNYPISINKKEIETIYYLNNFQVDISISLDKVYNIAQEIIDEQAEHPESICLSCLFDFGKENKVYIDLIDYENSTVFTIIDNNSQIKGESYKWNFAIA